MPQSAPVHGRGPKPPTDIERERHAFYTSKRWRRARAEHLKKFPLCARCLEESRAVPATQVDHKEERATNKARELDPTNFESLCATHHSQKTARKQRRRR